MSKRPGEGALDLQTQVHRSARLEFRMQKGKMHTYALLDNEGNILESEDMLSAFGDLECQGSRLQETVR